MSNSIDTTFFTPSLAIFLAAASPLAESLEVRITSIFFMDSCLAISKPMPRLEPVTRATDFSSIIAVFVFYQKGHYIIDNPAWILLSLFYKYPAELLDRIIIIVAHQTYFSQKISKSCRISLPSYRGYSMHKGTA